MTLLPFILSSKVYKLLHLLVEPATIGIELEAYLPSGGHFDRCGCYAGPRLQTSKATFGHTDQCDLVYTHVFGSRLAGGAKPNVPSTAPPVRRYNVFGGLCYYDQWTIPVPAEARRVVSTENGAMHDGVGYWYLKSLLQRPIVE